MNKNILAFIKILIKYSDNLDYVEKKIREIESSKINEDKIKKELIQK